MSDGFFLHGGVDNDLTELILGNQFQCHGHLYRAGQEFLDAFFAQQFAELDQLGRVAGPAVLKVFVARKVLPSGCLAPALDEVFVAFVEGVFEVQQGDHQAGQQARGSALETPAPAITSAAPNKSESSIFLPARTWRAKRWAREASISCQGMRLAKTANG